MIDPKYRTFEYIEKRLDAQDIPQQLSERPDNCPLCGEAFAVPEGELVGKYDEYFEGPCRMELRVGPNTYQCRSCQSLFMWNFETKKKRKTKKKGAEQSYGDY